jgi:hypothetical protein
MRRTLIGFGTQLGSYLAQQLGFFEFYTYKQAMCGIEPCDEAVLIAPAGKLLGGGILAPQGYELATKLTQSAARIVLLSSIDVYPAKGVPFDEYSLPFGLHRKAWLEAFEQEILSSSREACVLRLPEIFGLPGNRMPFNTDPSKMNRVAIHQWYPVRRLPLDIATAQAEKVRVVNLVSEPLPMAAILKRFFPGQIGKVVTPAPYSRIRTKYATLFGGSGSYIMSAQEVLEEAGRTLGAEGMLQTSAVRAGGPAPIRATGLAAACA